MMPGLMGTCSALDDHAFGTLPDRCVKVFLRLSHTRGLNEDPYADRSTGLDVPSEQLLAFRERSAKQALPVQKQQIEQERDRISFW